MTDFRAVAEGIVSQLRRRLKNADGPLMVSDAWNETRTAIEHKLADAAKVQEGQCMYDARVGELADAVLAVIRTPIRESERMNSLLSNLAGAYNRWDGAKQCLRNAALAARKDGAE